MMRLTAALLALGLLATPAIASAQLVERGQAPRPEFAEDENLQAVIDSPLRSDAHRARDVYRRPFESLIFWGLTPGMTVVEIEPGSEAWWTEILAPYAARTGGRYVAAWIDTANPQTSEAARNARAALEARFAADRATFGEATVVDFGPQSGVGLPDQSADMVLVARAFHNWAQAEGRTDRYMAEFFRVLRPGGVLAIEQHRAVEGLNVAETAPTGYVPESYVIQAAQRAGFVLDARSDVNANPMDSRDHPFGVWTLPPVRRSSQNGRTLTDAERAHFDAIGESDRMTLRFRRPETPAQ
ncbi:methyltransferase domain-containing protein [Brevundimonas sp.]|uniref:class I SAM-dependent methyltransferase n=1 Tax=Brevundimonas sp. TaxID=1871086 RepID=UPI0025D7D1A8|nr:methyltransferase domain-containing protein [Brevundimonas sp.]